MNVARNTGQYGQSHEIVGPQGFKVTFFNRWLDPQRGLDAKLEGSDQGEAHLDLPILHFRIERALLHGVLPRDFRLILELEQKRGGEDKRILPVFQ